VTHYEALGAAQTATPAELREAFRRAARASHPDRHGDASAERMAAVNEAWRVLGDPDRRRRYDADLAAGAQRSGSAGASSAFDPRSTHQPSTQQPSASPPSAAYHDPAYYEPARFPWRFMAALASVGIAVVLLGVIIYDPPPPAAPDGVLRHGDCVMLTAELEAVEVVCGNHDAVVDRLIPVDQVCPADTQPYRDRLGMGTACVVRSGP
jgi:hypothetical protein